MDVSIYRWWMRATDCNAKRHRSTALDGTGLRTCIAVALLYCTAVQTLASTPVSFPIALESKTPLRRREHEKTAARAYHVRHAGQERTISEHLSALSRPRFICALCNVARIT